MMSIGAIEIVSQPADDEASKRFDVGSLGVEVIAMSRFSRACSGAAIRVLGGP